MGLEAALLEVVKFLDGNRIPYMVIGGYANLFWGRSRVTQDIDLTVSCPAGRLRDVISLLGKNFQLLPRDPLAFAKRNRVLPLSVGRVRVDLVLAGLPYEEGAIRRARTVIVGGHEVKVCAPEDLIIHKVISERPQDREDVREIIRLRGRALDRTYMDPIVQELSAALERPDLLAFYRRCFEEAEKKREQGLKL